MLPIPSAVRTQFETRLRNAAIPKPEHAAYIKWLRYYLDFCQKYHFPHAQRESLPHFLHKLQEKKQTPVQQQQASRAVSLYYELIRFNDSHNQDASLKKEGPTGKALDIASHPPDSMPNQIKTSPKAISQRKAPPELSHQAGFSANAASPSTGASWVAVYTRLASEIQPRHYSPKTLKAYTQWLRHFQTFTRSKVPEALASADVKAFYVFGGDPKGLSLNSEPGL